MRAGGRAFSVAATLAASLIIANVALGDERSSAPTPKKLASSPLESARRVVVEVIEKLLAYHVDGESFEPRRLREGAIDGARELLTSRSWRDAVEGRALRRELGRLADGDLEGCFSVLDERAGATLESGSCWLLVDAMAKGALRAAGDPHTQLVDSATLNRLVGQVSGGLRPRGYGWRAGERPDGSVAIDAVFRGFDAQLYGLREGDLILEVDGRPAAAWPRDELAARLASLSGPDSLRVRVWREGWKAAHEVELEARVPHEPNVVSELLPGNIGYARIEAFLSRTPEDLEAALRKLERAGPLRGLVLDVRDNPGGSIASCVKTADLFLEPGQTIAAITSRGAAAQDLGSPALPPKLVSTPASSVVVKKPIVLLVNGKSASATEMLALALRENGRARLVGTRTYGKGRGQGPLALESTTERVLLLTSMTFYGPNGTSPNGTGIEPDVEVAPPPLPVLGQEEVVRLRASGQLEAYVNLHGPVDPTLILGLAKDDNGSIERWPGFEGFYRALQTELPMDVVRRELRRSARAYARSRGSILWTDLRDDAQLARGHQLVLEELARAPREESKPPEAPEREKKQARRYF
jgi:C-terminal peptidase prc